MPCLLKVVAAAKVLGDGDRVIKVKYGMVPTPRDENRLAGVLYELVDLD